jgi:uncharacterized protein (UPF0303 family)
MADRVDDDWPTIDELEDQERRLVLPAADLAALNRLGRRMADAAIERDLPLVVEIRSGSRMVFSVGLPGSTALNHRWAARKARTTEQFERSSLLVRLIHERNGEDIHTRHALPETEFAANGGAFPLRTADAGVIGSVVVSGLPQVQDHAFVVEQLALHIDTERREAR